MFLRILMLSVLLLSTASCATLGGGTAQGVSAGTANGVPPVVCSDPRPRICTMEYRPVCAQLVAGGEQTFASKCNACADIAVATYIPKQCEVR